MVIQNIFFSVMLILVGINGIFEGYKFYRKGETIIFSNERDKSVVVIIVFLIYRASFFDRNKFWMPGLVIGVVLALIYIICLIYYKARNYRVYVNYANENDVYRAFYELLKENSISYKNEDFLIKIEGTCTYVKFIEKGILIKKYRHMPGYEEFIKKLNEKLLTLERTTKKKRYIIEIILSIIILIGGIGLLVWLIF